MTQLVVQVFDFVADYADELGNREDLLTEFDEDTGLVLFCREFFNQFLSQEFEVQVVVFSSREASNAWVKIAPKLDQNDLRGSLVGAFREFCQDIDTVVGEHYDRGGELSAFQTEFVPELLDAIVKWAEAKDLSGIAEAAQTALETLNEAFVRAGVST